MYAAKAVEEIDYWSIEDPVKNETEDTGVNARYIYPTSVRYKQQLQLAAAAEDLQNKPFVPVGAVPRTSLGSGVSGPAGVALAATPAAAVRCVTSSPTENSASTAAIAVDPLAATPSPNSVRQVPSSTRPLSEVPLSNRKLRSYNVKIKANNQLLAANAAAAAPAHHMGGKQTAPVPAVAVQKLLPTELPSFMPPARLVLSQQTKQKLADICGESDSEDERVLIPRALKGYPELGMLHLFYRARLSLLVFFL